MQCNCSYTVKCSIMHWAHTAQISMTMQWSKTQSHINENTRIRTNAHAIVEMVQPHLHVYMTTSPITLLHKDRHIRHNLYMHMRMKLVHAFKIIVCYVLLRAHPLFRIYLCCIVISICQQLLQYQVYACVMVCHLNTWLHA